MGRTVREFVDREEWNTRAMRAHNFNVFSSFEWGEFKRDSWDVRRFGVFSGSELIGGVQLLTRRPLGLRVGWAPGGVVVVDPERMTDVIRTLADRFRAPYVIRFNFDEEATPERRDHLSATPQLTGANRPIRAGRTVVFDLLEHPPVSERMTARHRRSLRKAATHRLAFDVGEPSASLFSSLHGEMRKLKGFAGTVVAPEDVGRLSRAFGPRLRMYSVAHDGETVAACLLLQFPRHAYYLLAATGERGRELRASFVLVTRMIDALREAGVRHFDFGGIAPDRADARGVNDFKLGFRGREICRLGEYDLSNSVLLRRLFNRFVATRIS